MSQIWRKYEVFGTLDDYPVGHKRFFMRKSLGSIRSKPSP